ncbi:hypothetical protein PHYC_03862 [Phycisphaerales bacterium]|nr:hypothetical protein PHYC_03862 [Phycisphaerales bacterium]
MSLVWLALASAVLIVGPAGCDLDERRAVRRSMIDFRAACNRQKADEALALMSSNTFPYYDRMVHKARTMKAEEVHALPLAEMYTILGIRHKLSREQLRSADGRAYLRASIESGYEQTDEERDPTEHMGIIKIRKDVATAPALDAYGKQTRYLYYFVKEGGVWKQDFSRGNEAISLIIEQIAEAYNMSSELAVRRILMLETGREVPHGIWDPPK